MKQETPKQHVELINDNIEEFDKAIELFKQETTLEEAAERISPIQQVINFITENFQKEGEARQLSMDLLKKWCEVKLLNEESKWQQERSYSEEDLKEAFDSAREFNSLDGIVDIHIVLPMGGDMSDLQPLHFTFEEWFEQFKKK